MRATVQLKPGIPLFFEQYRKLKVLYFKDMKANGLQMHIIKQGRIYFRGTIAVQSKIFGVNENKHLATKITTKLFLASTVPCGG